MSTDGEDAQRARELLMASLAESRTVGPTARRPKKRRGSTLLAAAVAVAVVTGLVMFGSWQDGRDRPTAREEMLLEVEAQCDTMHEVLASDRSLEEQAETLRAIGVTEDQSFADAMSERTDTLELECGDAVNRSRGVVRRQNNLDELENSNSDDDGANPQIEPDQDARNVEAEADRLALVYGYTFAGSAPGEGAALAELTCERAALDGWDYDKAVADDIAVGAPQQAAVGWNTFVYEEFCPAVQETRRKP